MPAIAPAARRINNNSTPAGSAVISTSLRMRLQRGSSLLQADEPLVNDAGTIQGGAEAGCKGAVRLGEGERQHPAFSRLWES